MKKRYRCGYCGHPSDEKGNPIDPNGIPEKEFNDAELVHGHCCVHEFMTEPTYITVTRDMAIDAGDPDLEGQRIKW